MSWASNVGDKLNLNCAFFVAHGDLKRAKQALQANGIKCIWPMNGTFQVKRDRYNDAIAALNAAGIGWT